MKHQHARPRQQRGVEFERRIFRGGADQHHGAVFHHGQKQILLRAVEAMHLVDEQQRALAHLAAGARGVEHLLQVGDAGKHRGNLLEMQFGRIRQQPRHRGLAGAGRAPEHQRAQRARLQHARQRAVGTQDMILADDVGRACAGAAGPAADAAHPAPSLRRQRGWRLARSLRAHPPSVTLICWPPRTTVMRQSLDAAFARLVEIAGLGDLLVVDGQDDVALLESDTGGRAVVGEIGDDDAFGLGIEMQFVGDRRRDVGDLGALERRARGQHDLVAAGVGRGLQRHRQLDGLAAALHVDLRRAAERPRREAIVERVGIVDRLPVDRDDQVGQFQARPRAAGLFGDDIGDQRAGRAASSPASRRSRASPPAAARQATAASRPCRRSWRRRRRRAPCWQESQSRCPASRRSARRSRC